MSFQLKSVQEVLDSKYHRFLTNASSRTVNLPITVLGKKATGDIFAPLEKGKSLHNIGGAISSLLDNYFSLNPKASIGVAFDTKEELEYWEEIESKRLGGLGIVITDDTQIPNSRGNIIDIIEQANEEMNKASMIDTGNIQNNIQSNLSNQTNDDVTLDVTTERVNNKRR